VNQRVRRRKLLTLIDSCLREGATTTIEIDGLGSFELQDQLVTFQPSNRVRVFLAYAAEDRALVRKLYRALQKAGFEPWMDEQKLLPGQNWPRAVERAMDLSDFVLACFSRRSTGKRGYFQCELRYALDLAARMPLDDVFFVPVRFDDCELPRHIVESVHYVDMFPNWKRGVQSLISSIRRQCVERNKRNKPPK
jgi:hypothetical protein